MVTAAVVLVAAPATSSASAYNTVPCWVSGHHTVLKHKPRTCTLGGRFGYQQVDVIRMRWRSWGGENAVGRGVSIANMGSRARVRVQLFRPVRWEENTFRFSRARFEFDRGGWGPPLVLRLN
jgi:hypothetical protein